MYTTHNYKTKKALRTDVDRYTTLCDDKLWELQHPNEGMPFAPEQQRELTQLANRLVVYQPNSDITGAQGARNGRCTLEGPHYPLPHKWYAQATLKDGIVVAVK